MTDAEWEAELWERIRIQPPAIALAILNKSFENGDLSQEAYRRLADRPRVTDWKALEGDRIFTTDGRWASVLEVTRPWVYKVRYDDAPNEGHWISDEKIDRLHRG